MSDIWETLLGDYLARKGKEEAKEGGESGGEEQTAPSAGSASAPPQALQAAPAPSGGEAPSGSEGSVRRPEADPAVQQALLMYYWVMQSTAYSDYNNSPLREMGVSWDLVQKLIHQELAQKYTEYAQKPFGYYDAYTTVKRRILEEASAKPELFAALGRRGVETQEAQARREEEMMKRYLEALEQALPGAALRKKD